MWRSTSICLRRAIRLRTAGVAARVVAAGRQPPVDLLELIADRTPVAARARRALEQLASQGAFAGEPLDLARQGDRVAGREHQPQLAPVDAARRRAAAARRPARCPSRAPRGPAPAPAAARRRRRTRCRRPPPAPRDAIAAARRRCTRSRRRFEIRTSPPSGSQIAASQSSVSGSRRSARMKRRSAPRSSSRQYAMRNGALARGLADRAIAPRATARPARPARSRPGSSAA